MSFDIVDLPDGSKKVVSLISATEDAPTVAELEAKLAVHQGIVDELTAQIAELTPFEDTVIAHNSSL